jgi:adenylosuccinate lyase
VALEMQEKGVDDNDLFDRLAADDRLRLSRSDLATLVADPLAFTGVAAAQVADVVGRVTTVVTSDPAAAAYRPSPVL